MSGVSISDPTSRNLSHVFGNEPSSHGLPNAQELLAGTNPFDAASTLHLGVTRTSDANVELRFASVVGRTYAVECCTDLKRSVWFTLRDNIPGTGAPIPFIDEAAATRGPQCFYRLRVWR